MTRDEQFVGCLAGNLRAAARVVTRVYDVALRQHGVRITQVALLTTVRRLQPLTTTELAGELVSERSAVTRDVGRLQRAGLLRSAPRPGDGRAREVSITADGEALLRRCAPAWRAVQQASRDAIGAEQATELVRLATGLVAALDPAAQAEGST
jgi:DNA-binding MarR family transcriptional regulator